MSSPLTRTVRIGKYLCTVSVPEPVEHGTVRLECTWSPRRKSKLSKAESAKLRAALEKFCDELARDMADAATDAGLLFEPRGTLQ